MTEAPLGPFEVQNKAAMAEATDAGRTGPTPDADGWTRNRFAFTAEPIMMAMTMPWLIPDRNPFPRFHLFRRG